MSDLGICFDKILENKEGLMDSDILLSTLSLAAQLLNNILMSILIMFRLNKRRMPPMRG